MSTFLAEVRETLIPERNSKHGPLPQLLLAMTLLTGLVDAFSFLVLGHVFVANMTGNVVFLGFALVGVPGFSIVASVVALASFWCGALAGGKVGSRLGKHRGRLLSTAASIQVVFLAASVVLAALSRDSMTTTTGFRYPLIVVLGIAMGIQNATARKLAVPDMTTTVLTLTITGTAADSSLAGGKGSLAGRRFIAVATMLVGALIGAALIIHVYIVYPLVIALIVMVIVATATRLVGKPDSPWARA